MRRYVSGLLGYFHLITKYPSSVVMILCFFYHPVLRVPSFCWPSNPTGLQVTDLILTASWHSEGSPVCAHGCGSRWSFSTAPASSNSLPAHRHLPSLCPRRSILHTLTRLMLPEPSIHKHSCCFKSFRGTVTKPLRRESRLGGPMTWAVMLCDHGQGSQLL